MKSQQIDDLIARVAQGEIGIANQVLNLLAFEYLLLPVSTKFNTGDARGTQRVTVPTMKMEQRLVVPAFTSEDAFSAWSDGQHHCLSLLGADVVDSVPSGAGLIINPGGPFSLELSPAELKTIIRMANEDSASANGVAALEREDGQAKRARRGTDELRSKKRIDKFSDLLIPQLRLLFREFPAVLEGYIIPVKTTTSEAVLGLLTEGLKADRRFELLSRVAELSREVFGNVGAVEVFDDLHSRVSTSWELFQAQTPFYCRVPSAGDLAVERDDSGSGSRVAQSEDQKPADSKVTSAPRGKLFLVSKLFRHGAGDARQ